MKILKYIPLIIMCLCSLQGLAQKTTSKEKKKKAFSFGSVELERASHLLYEEPERAIEIIESVITNKKEPPKTDVLATAYILLGNVYIGINQPKLARERYIQAKDVLFKTDYAYLKALNFYCLGELELWQENLESAGQYYNQCMIVGDDKMMLMKCEEGSTDVSLAKGKYQTSYVSYNHILDNYQLDSFAIAIIEAKKTQALVMQDKLEEAKENYQLSLNTLPAKITMISSKEFKSIEKANELLIANTINIDDKIKISESSLDMKMKMKSKIPPKYIVSEHLKLADYHREKGAFETAEKYIQDSKEFLKDKNNPEQAARVIEEDLKIKSQKGDYAQVELELENFKSANQMAVLEKEKKLGKNAEIVDNIRKIDIVGKDLEIKAKDEQLLENQLNTQRYIIGLLTLLLLASLASFYLIMRNVRAKRKANSLLLLKSLRTQMNPHFIFNALNSVNNYISQNDERAANKFLTDFSKLMRMVLDYSQKDFIPFEDEVHLIELYLKLEHSRFKDKFDYEIDKDKHINYSGVEIPPMLIQPFIENAVWHGLRYKKEKGRLLLSIQQADGKIVITVKDDGIGRAKSKALKTKNQKQYKSTGLQNVDKRLHLINDIYAKNYEIKVTDVDTEQEETGTLVEIII